MRLKNRNQKRFPFLFSTLNLVCRNICRESTTDISIPINKHFFLQHKVTPHVKEKQKFVTFKGSVQYHYLTLIVGKLRHFRINKIALSSLKCFKILNTPPYKEPKTHGILFAFIKKCSICTTMVC